MKTLDEIRAGCEVEEITGCWIWTGAYSDKLPRIYAQDWVATRDRFEAAIDKALGSRYETDRIKKALVEAMDPVMTSQAGRRGVWNIASGQPIPSGYRVYGTCLHDECVSPDHARCGSGKELGKFTAKTGRYKRQPNRIAANRATNLKRSKLTPELVDEILLSDETGVQLTNRLGLGRTIVSKVRTGALMVHRPGGGLFAGLGARA